MQITKLRLSGFKSFVHPTELLIEPGLTGVVGPNGCGKSNLVEALRWVMGETSARGLRSGEMDDVIFAGTGARPAHDHADVVVQLRRAGPSLPQFDEEDEFELVRRIGRGIGSAYRVNGREIRARDVQLLFADASSGARSAAIVSQGQIGSLVEAKPTDRRRLLEAAAGTAGLQARRHEAELKLRATDANLVRLQDLLATLEDQHRSLRKQARQAARYRELSAAYRDAEAALLVGRWQMAGVELAATEDAYRRGRVDVAERTAMVEEARKQRDQAAQALPELRQRDAVMATDLARLGERLSAVIEEQTKLEGRKHQLAERRQQIDQDVAHGHAALGDAGTMRQQLEQECVALGQAAEQSTIELERSAEEEQVAREALDVAETSYRDRLEAVAEIEARRSQLTDRKVEIDKRREEHDATELEIHAALEGLSNPSDIGDAPALASAETRASEARSAAEAADATLRHAEHVYLSLRSRELASRHLEIEQQRSALNLAAVENQVAAAQAAADLAATARDKARGETEEAEAQRSDSEAALRKQQTVVERAQAEAEALTALVEPSTADKGVIDLVDVP
ncbi:MAG: AAA family ATPase, partial [Pseudomonadota bacterium]